MPTRAEFSLKRRAVLLVDESTDARKTVEDMCHAVGFGAINTVRSNEIAMAHLQDYSYDVVLCDWDMPTLGGLEFVQSVRSREDTKLRDTPIVLLKVLPTQTDIHAARAAGATKLLARPFSIGRLIDTMKQIFSSPLAWSSR